MLTVAFTLSLAFAAQSASPDEGPTPILVLDLKASGIEEDQLAVVNDILGQSVSRHAALKVISTEDIRRMVDVDTERQIVGCDDASCMSQLAGAFGARYLLYGSVAKLGGLYVVQLTLFDSDKADGLGRVRTETRDLSELTSAMDAAVDDVCRPLLGDPIQVPLPATDWSTVGLWTTTGGAVLALLGGGLVIAGALPYARYNDAAAELDQARAAFEGGESAALDRAIAARAKADEQQSAWEGYGLALTSTGIALAAVGVVAASAGGLLWSGALELE